MIEIKPNPLALKPGEALDALSHGDKSEIARLKAANMDLIEWQREAEARVKRLEDALKDIQQFPHNHHQCLMTLAGASRKTECTCHVDRARAALEAPETGEEG